MANRIQGITVEIGGDTTKLTTALKGVNSEIRNTQSQLKDVEKLLKLDPHNSELLAQKQRLLTDAIGETKDKMEALKSAQQQVQAQFERGDITKDQYDALQREIIEAEQNLKDLEKQAQDTNTSLSGFTQAAEKIGKFGDAATSAGQKMLPVTAAITAAGGASAKMAMDFEDSMAKVNTIADTTEVPLSELQKAILDLSNQTGISSTEIAGNVYDAISAGQKTGDAVNFVSNSTMLAEFSTSMGKIIPTAKANGVALDQVAAGYAIMTANGVATAEYKVGRAVVMAFVQYLTFDGMPLPMPDSYDVELTDVEADSGGETEAGTNKAPAGKQLTCAVNPAAMREVRYGLRPCVKPKKVVVVGGGVAGMEAARTAAIMRLVTY